MKFGRHFDENGKRVMYHKMPFYERGNGELIKLDLIIFADEFFGMKPEDVIALDEDRFNSLKGLVSLFMDLPDKATFAIFNAGFGETFEEMYTHAKSGVLFPKFVREYVEKQIGKMWDEFDEGDEFIVIHDRHRLIADAVKEKFGSQVWCQE